MEKYIRLELESSVFTTKNGEESRIELKQAGAKKTKGGWGGNRCTQTTWFMIGKYHYPNL
jgi:hypothetical protein